MHLRAMDATAMEVDKLRRFTSLCNAGASVIARGAQASTMLTQSPGPLQQGTASHRESCTLLSCSCVKSMTACLSEETMSEHDEPQVPLLVHADHADGVCKE